MLSGALNKLGFLLRGARTKSSDASRWRTGMNRRSITLSTKLDPVYIGAVVQTRFGNNAAATDFSLASELD